jgi:AraC-like DNA-binding protein
VPGQVAQISADPRSLSELLGALELGGATWCYCDFAADGGFSLPPSEAVLFHAVLHGSIRLALPGGNALELGAGEAVALPSGEAHALRIAPENAAAGLDFLKREQVLDVPPTFQIGSGGAVAARVLSGRLSISLPAGASRSALPPLLQLGKAAESRWGALLKPEALAVAGIGPGGGALLTRVAALMITAELRCDPRCRELFAPERRDPIGQALRLIAGNPSANWTVERLARSVGMGRSNFAAHFTAAVGRAPMEVVAEQRMEHAAQLLRKGSLKIAEISELSGYGSEAAFSRRFTRQFGISPSQMREKARSESAAGTSEVGLLRLLGARRGAAPAASERATEPAKPARSRPNLFNGGLLGERRH